MLHAFYHLFMACCMFVLSFGFLLIALATLMGCLRDKWKSESYFEGYKDGYKKGFRQGLDNEEE